MRVVLEEHISGVSHSDLNGVSRIVLCRNLRRVLAGNVLFVPLLHAPFLIVESDFLLHCGEVVARASILKAA